MSRAVHFGGDHMKLAIGSVAIAFLVASQGNAATINVAAGKDAQERLQSALIDAKPGDLVLIGPGRFELTDGLSLDVANVTIKGAGQGKTVLDFKGQMAAGEGLMITSSGATVRDLTVLDAKGDAVKAKGVDQISFIDMSVDWSGPPKSTNGAYGVYPVASTNVLIDGVTVRGASDAGIYVGQSRNIVVKRSRAEFNVAGIEIENSMNADVHDNVSTHNAGGILVFDLPNLPVQGGHSHRIYHNQVVDNDTQNFAPKGNIVASVPTGTGIMVMANHDVHVFDNTIGGNASVAIMLIGYKREIKDAKYEPLPTDVVIRDNKIGRNGFDPQIDGMKGMTLPPVVWDGATHFVRDGAGEDRAINVVIKDGPVLKLNLKDVANMQTARLQKISSIEGAAVAEPQPVVLPPSQASLSTP
jgi:parallel beta-helix repeat protein